MELLGGDWDRECVEMDWSTNGLLVGYGAGKPSQEGCEGKITIVYGHCSHFNTVKQCYSHVCGDAGVN